MSHRQIISAQAEQVRAADAELDIVRRQLSSADATARVGRAQGLLRAAAQLLDSALRQPLDGDVQRAAGGGR